MKDKEAERRAMPAGSCTSELGQVLHFTARAHVPALLGCQQEGGYVLIHPETAPGSRAFPSVSAGSAAPGVGLGKGRGIDQEIKVLPVPQLGFHFPGR